MIAKKRPARKRPRPEPAANATAFWGWVSDHPGAWRMVCAAATEELCRGLLIAEGNLTSTRRVLKRGQFPTE